MPEITAEVRQIIADMDQSVLDIGEARSLPSKIYTSQSFYEFELEALFYREWLGLGHQSQIPNPGDYFTITVADEPLIVVRQKDQSIKVLSSICRHRGHPVLPGDAHDPKNRQAFTCPYHHWTYGIDGQLRGAPEMNRTYDIKKHCAETRLPELKVEIFHGLIFANFDPDASALTPTLGKLDEELNNRHLGDMVAMPTDIEADLSWNWKIMHENGLEPYHTTYVHAGYHDMAPARLATFIDWDPEDGQIMHPTGFTEIDCGFNPRHKAPFPVIPTLTEEQRKYCVFGSVPPTVFFCLLPDQAFTFIILPRGVDKMDLLLTFYYPPETMKMEHFAWAYEGQRAATGAFGVQDEYTNRMLQQGLRSKFAPRGRLGHQEGTLPQLNRWLLRRYTSYLDEIDAASAPSPRGLRSA